MTFHRLGLAAAAAVIALPLSVAPLNAGGVIIFYPPKLASNFDRPGDNTKAADHSHKTDVKVAVQVRLVERRDRRRRYIQRSLGHRYLGFVKVYSGPRYPY